MTAILIGFCVILYPALAVAMHLLLKTAPKRPTRNNGMRADTSAKDVHAASQSIAGKHQVAGRINGTHNMGPSADWSESATPSSKSAINQTDTVIPFASWV